MIRLYRILPLILVLAVVAIVIYFVLTWRYSSNKAKEVLIRVFTWITIVISVFFGLVTLYAVFEQNIAVIELAGSCLAIGLIGLLITRICNHVFRKNHPSFRVVTEKATIVNESLGSKFAAAFRKALGEALRETFGHGSKGK